MKTPENTFKTRLRAGETLAGCWLGLADIYAAEIVGNAGFDWVLIDGEHAPNDMRSIRDQLIALAATGSHPVVRLPVGETWMIKQALDIGARTLMIPMVESAAQARELVKACHYPPSGTRGVGSALARASQFSAYADYMQAADAQISLIVQVENRAGLAALDEILAVDGIDCVFIGPADLAADMGHAGNSAAPAVHEAILDAFARISAAGIAPGVLTADAKMAGAYREAGARFLGVGIDVLLLAHAARDLAARWTGERAR